MRRSVICCAALNLVFMGCVHKPRPTMGMENAPEWVVHGGGWAAEVSGKRAFYGVGTASDIHGRSMLMESADAKARVEISKIFSVFVRGIYSERQSLAGTQAERNIYAGTEAVLSGVLIKDHWTNPETGELYSLAVLDLDWVVDNIGKSSLSETFKDSVRQAAVTEFGHISK